MKAIEKISVEEFDKKDFLVNSEDSIPVNHKKAVVTHFLHNVDDIVAKVFQNDAKSYINQLLEYKERETETLTAEDALQQLLFEVTDVPFPTPENYSFKFIDLFAGIGGFRMALQNVGGKCIFTSEWDKEAQKTYRANYGEIPFGDITKKETKDFIPSNFDVLCAGFPCQAFSIAGYQKGFADTRGTLFFDIEQIIEKHKPKVVFLENVKNLVSHDDGKTFKIILDSLENKLGYKVFYKVLNTATHANIPQNRERIFIVAFNPKLVKNYNDFTFPEPIKLEKKIHDFIDDNKQLDIYYYNKDHQYFKALDEAIKSKRYSLSMAQNLCKRKQKQTMPNINCKYGSRWT